MSASLSASFLAQGSGLRWLAPVKKEADKPTRYVVGFLPGPTGPGRHGPSRARRLRHPAWGARKIRERLLRRYSDIKLPAKSTIHAVLDRHGLVEPRGRVRTRAQGTALSLGERPNQLFHRNLLRESPN